MKACYRQQALGVRLLFVFSIMFLSLPSVAAQKISGKVLDSAGVVLPSISVFLLNPQDSTFAFFDITNAEGHFEIKVTKDGTYLLQVAALGYQTYYREITIPLSEPDLTIALAKSVKARQLSEVTIKGERIPLRLKGDTLEYDADAFKVKPGGVVEDLLRKLPGLDVDKVGNVTSMGKSVQKILVDGKEFFGNDPKVATKNLPADAISKIQAFESKSQSSLFTGLDDGQREQTLNLILKEGKKKGIFGSAEAGGGIQNKYEGSLKAFKFRKNSQLATLAMLNNINKFGFSVQDYINFNGGIQGLMQNGGGQIPLGASSFPLDVGQPSPGAIASAALGLNYSIELQDNNRLNLSYLGNGLKKALSTHSQVANYLPTLNYETQGSENNEQRQLNNGLNIHWRKTADSSYQLEARVFSQLAVGSNSGREIQNNFRDNVLVNRLDMESGGRHNSNKLGGEISGILKTHKRWHLLKSTLNFSAAEVQDELNNINQWEFANPFMQNKDSLYRSNRQKALSATMEISAVRTLGQGYYLEPSLSVAADQNTTFRLQGRGVSDNYNPIDSLISRFRRNALQYKAALSLQRHQKNGYWTITLTGDVVQMHSAREGIKEMNSRSFFYLLPYIYWQRALKRGQRLSANYQTTISLPNALQMMPAADYSNPLFISEGNLNVKPEYHHQVNVHYSMFDEFNLSSLFLSLSGDYIVHKISWAQTTFPDLSSRVKVINTPAGATANFSASYGQPIPSVGLKFRFSLNENAALTENIINDVASQCRSLTHKVTLNLSNRNQDKWQAQGGMSYALTSANYSVNNERNLRYNTLGVFGELSYQPSKSWEFSIHADGTYYDAQSFGNVVFVPLVNFEISRYLFSNQRASLRLRVFDLLNKNQSLQRFSQNNQLLEQQSNIIHRYAMLTFSYRFSPYGKSKGMVEVQ